MYYYKDYQIIEHTADIALKAYGKHKKDLFVNAARGLFFIIFNRHPKMQKGIHYENWSISCSGSNLEDVMFSWLSELLYIHLTKALVLENFLIDSLNGQRLRAEVQGVCFKQLQLTVIREIKGVTYYGLSIKKDTSGIWNTQIIFDI